MNALWFLVGFTCGIISAMFICMLLLDEALKR